MCLKREALSRLSSRFPDSTLPHVLRLLTAFCRNDICMRKTRALRTYSMITVTRSCGDDTQLPFSSLKPLTHRIRFQSHLAIMLFNCEKNNTVETICQLVRRQNFKRRTAVKNLRSPFTNQPKRAMISQNEYYVCCGRFNGTWNGVRSPASRSL